ncbi:MAG: peptidoglycan editing factor PgeF [Mariprofundaceae bacterium]|nr:peptidoglycan editing factor PgeF [Mariprofundaceae bacterium]
MSMSDDCFLRSELLSSHGAIGIFSSRHGGISPPPFDSLNLGSGLGDDEGNVAHNLNILTSAASLPRTPHRAIQVHGAGVLVCRNSGDQHQDQADILIGVDGAAIAVRVADCVPVLLADPEAGVIAAVHAGWRGTVAQATIHAVKAMVRHGAKPEQIFACIGPCIGPCCFEIDTNTANNLSRCCDGAHRFIHHVDNETYADLAGINARQLRCAGITQAHIERISECTCCDEQRFYSWRRDGKMAGRHLAVVALPDAS